MSNTFTVQRSAKAAKMARRAADRRAKYAAIALDWHGHIVDECETDTLSEAQDWGKLLLETNSLVSLVDVYGEEGN